jgi:hypothetical protein
MKRPTKDDVVCRTLKGYTFKKRRWEQPKCKKWHKGERSETAAMTEKKGKCQ